MKLTPASNADAMMRCEVGASVRSPNIMVPRQSTETSSPESPRRRKGIDMVIRTNDESTHADANAGNVQSRRPGLKCGGCIIHILSAAVLSPMHVFFEDDGAFKAGTVLADNEASLQVEAASGKRLKIKAANVLLRFSDPSPSALLADAQALAGTLDPNFLWEVSGEREFAFTELATDYFGRAPRPAESAALALCLHGSPMHFYKKGKGRYRAAPPEALKAALAGAERKRHEAEQVAQYASELEA